MVWIVCEDQGLFFPEYGDSTVAMPAIAALAAEGTVFDQMFAASPVCAPSRSCILTGVMPTAMGTQHMRAYGKAKRANPHTGLPFYSAPAPDGVRAFTEYLRQCRVYCTNRSKEDYNFETPPLAWDDSSPTAHWRNRPASAPFFSVFNLFASHESQVWARSGRDCPVAPDQVQVPPILPDDPAVRADLATNYCNLMTVDSMVGALVAELKADGLYDQTTIVFTSDHGGPLPGFKRSVSDAGLHVPFVVKWSKDMGSEPRHQGLFSFLDLAPMALAHFGVEVPLALSGMPITPKSTGHTAVFGAGDRFDSELHRKRSIRTERWRLTHNQLQTPELSTGIAFRNQMATMKAMAAQFENQNGETNLSPLDTVAEWQLYDVLADPWCTHNLAAEVGFQPTLDSLIGLLNQEFAEQDWGQWDESEMVAHFSAAVSAAPLAEAVLTQTEQGWRLSHPNEHVSLGWRCSDPNAPSWNVAPIPSDLGCDTLETMAHRIGWPPAMGRRALR